MQVVADVTCYHCGHVSGQVEGERADRLVLHAFKPREGYRGTMPLAGERLKCERCGGPVFLEDIHAAPPPPEPVSVAELRGGRSQTKGRVA